LDISKLLDHAQACFMDWYVSFREERERRFTDLGRGDLSIGRRAVSAVRICEEMLVREVTKRIEIYKAVSDEYRNTEMLSTPLINQFREQVMTSVRSSIGELKGHLSRAHAAAGDPTLLPDSQRFVTIEANILDVVNTKLRVLETEGAIRNGDIVPPTDSTAKAQRGARIDVSRHTGLPSRTVVPQALTAARAPSSTDASAMDSPTRIKFETGLARAEVTLDQDLEDQGPTLGIARKYVTSATLTLARCILTPNCREPYEAIRRAYDFAEWFAAQTMKTAWVWLCVFGEMDRSGKLEKYKREGRMEDGAPKEMTDSELREWHGCLSGVAQEALDEFVPEFWKERLKYFSDIASCAPRPGEDPRVGLDTNLPPLQGDGPTPLQQVTDGEPSDRAIAAKRARARTVARIIRELDQLRPQMFEDQKEYDSLRVRYPDFLAFVIAEQRPDLKTKLLAIRASTRHIRLAQEIAAAHHGRQLSTIRDDWKDFKPEEFKHPR
jgi:hypothetical protein